MDVLAEILDYFCRQSIFNTYLMVGMVIHAAADCNTMAGAMFKHLSEEIDSIMTRDPSARSRLEVLLTFPGLHAVIFHRISHWLWDNGFRLSGRFVANVSRMLTGIDIHPGAVIGQRFFVDHGGGVVIGETAEIGHNVTMYQGVTLGGTSPSVDSRAQVDVKRHPTLQDNVIVSSGAQVLGPIVIGHGARVGANAVVLKDVPAGVAVVGVPARATGKPKTSTDDEFCPYGVSGDVIDPQIRALEGVLDRVRQLSLQVEALERKLLAVSPSGVNGSGNNHALNVGDGDLPMPVRHRPSPPEALGD